MMTYQFFKTTRIVMALMAFYPAFLFAETDVAGHIIAIRGDVTAVNVDGEERALETNSDIFAKDTIKTGKRGRTQIMFKDNTIISLGSKSEMVVSEYNWNPEENDGMMTAKINEGVFRIMGGAITKASPQQFKTETLSATIGIRGSMFSGKVDGEHLTVLFEAGKGIEVSNSHGSVLITKAGFGTMIQSITEPPSLPVRMSSSMIRSLSVAGSGETSETGGTESMGTEMPSDESEESETNEMDKAADINPSENIVLRSLPGKYIGVDENNINRGNVVSYLFSDYLLIEYMDFGGDALSFRFDLPDTVSLSNPTYEGTQSWYFNKPVRVNGETFYLPVKLQYSNLHQFYIMSGQEIVNGADGPFTFTTLATAGIPSDAPGSPTTVSRYDGRFLKRITSASSDQTDTTLAGMNAAINWGNKKMFGVLKSEDNPENILNNAYFMGTVGEGQAADLEFFGFEGGHTSTDNLSWIKGSTSQDAGQFYGTFQQGFDFGVDGDAYDLSDMTANGDVYVNGGAMLDKDTMTTVKTGTDSWEGFAVGIHNAQTDSDTSSVFMNDSSSDVSISMDRDLGTVSSTVNVTDGSTSMTVAMGGENGSVFVDDKSFIARTGSTNVSSGQTGVMVTADYDDQFGGDAISWGYWGVHENGKNYGYWVAGKRSTLDEITTKLTGGTTLQYRGKAYGTEISSAGVETSMGAGVSTVTLDFAAHTAKGKLDFTNVDINFSASDLSDAGAFKGTVTNMDSGTVSGAVFGQSAGAVAGNFNATNNNTRYTGIYGAKLTE